MSIAVIIGLIVAGILLADPCPSAEIRSLISDVDNIRAAITTFQEKYNCLPGACINATDYWELTQLCAGTAGTGTKPARQWRWGY